MEEKESDHHDEPPTPIHQQTDGDEGSDRQDGPSRNSESASGCAEQPVVIQQNLIYSEGTGDKVLLRENSSEGIITGISSDGSIVGESEDNRVDAPLTTLSSSSSSPCEEEVDTTSTIATSNSNNHSIRSHDSSYKPIDDKLYTSRVSSTTLTPQFGNRQYLNEPDDSKMV